MKTSIIAVGLALGANAAPASHQCWFSINAYGVKGTVSEGYWGPVKQLPDGQLRIGQWDLKQKSKFCLNMSNYGLTDQNGFGCLIAGREKQFQCDSGKAPFTGWNVGCEGIVTIHGSAAFYACATGDHGGYNIYTGQLPGSYCNLVTLIADAQCNVSCKTLPRPPKPVVQPPRPVLQPPKSQTPCGGVNCPGFVPPPIQTPVSPPVSRPVPSPKCTESSCTSSSLKYSGSSFGLVSLKCPGPDCVGHLKDTCKGKADCYKTWSCPDVLKGNWEFPHLIVPVSSYNPHYAPGTQYFGTVSSSTKSYFNFDIPQSYKGKQCTVKFMLPTKDQLETSDYTLKGKGSIMAGWAKEVSQNASWNTAPKHSKTKGFTLETGRSYVLGKTECKPGVMGFVMAGEAGTYLHWFQDYNPCPIGLYLTAE